MKNFTDQYPPLAQTCSARLGDECFFFASCLRRVCFTLFRFVIGERIDSSLCLRFGSFMARAGDYGSSGGGTWEKMGPFGHAICFLIQFTTDTHVAPKSSPMDGKIVNVVENVARDEAGGLVASHGESRGDGQGVYWREPYLPSTLLDFMSNLESSHFIWPGFSS